MAQAARLFERMPEQTFVLPHWLYWLGLIAFPLAAYYIFRRTAARKAASPQPQITKTLAYFFCLPAVSSAATART